MKLISAGIVAAALLLGCSGCGGDSTFTASGKLGLVAVNAATDDCSAGTGGYDDIHEGTSVVIYDAAGKKLAVGALDAWEERGTSGLCLFDFEVPDVPSGVGPYGVEVSSRGQVTFKENQADSIVISLG